MLQLGKSEKAFDEAKRYMPGGVNSPVRSYRSVGSNPPLVRKGKFTKFERENGVLTGKYYKVLPKALMAYYLGLKTVSYTHLKC